jgi:hypothetical protein
MSNVGEKRLEHEGRERTRKDAKGTKTRRALVNVAHLGPHPIRRAGQAQLHRGGNGPGQLDIFRRVTSFVV